MAVYKVPQDVEAEDKLIGPFSFRQFIFLLILVGFVYFAYLLLRVSIVLIIIPLPFIVFFAALAFPWRKDQPTEVYLTALIHFWTKPRKRIWNQEGHVEHVQITVPKQIKHQYTDGLSNTEVRSRLHSLASTLDTGGWDSKHLGAQTTEPQDGGVMTVQASDRLVMPMAQPETSNPATAITPQDDVMDATHNPVAQNFDTLVNKATQDRKSQLIAQMQQAVSEAPPASDADGSPSFNPYPEMRQHVINPGGPPPAAPPFAPTAQPNQPVDPEAQSAILNLANNSDLNVSTIARQAEQAMQSGDTIELH